MIRFRSGRPEKDWKYHTIDSGLEVEDVRSNQERLIMALNDIVYIDKPYFIDGHFCLLDNDHNIVPVESSIIKAINPRFIFLLSEEINVIHDRLLSRDGKDYDLEMLRLMSEKEEELARTFSITYDVPLFSLTPKEYNKVNDIITAFGQDYDI